MQPDLFPPIETPRLRLRCVALDDAAAIARMMTPEISRWVAAWPIPFTPEMAAERIQSSLRRAQDGDALPFVVADKVSRELIGWLGVHRDRDNRRRGMIGYWFGEKHHGKGYMWEIAPVTFAAGFELMDLNAIEATVQPDNAASIAVIEACGMRFVGEQMYYASARQRDELCLTYEIHRPNEAGVS